MWDSLRSADRPSLGASPSLACLLASGGDLLQKNVEKPSSLHPNDAQHPLLRAPEPPALLCHFCSSLKLPGLRPASTLPSRPGPKVVLRGFSLGPLSLWGRGQRKREAPWPPGLGHHCLGPSGGRSFVSYFPLIWAALGLRAFPQGPCLQVRMPLRAQPQEQEGGCWGFGGAQGPREPHSGCEAGTSRSPIKPFASPSHLCWQAVEVKV